MSAYGKPVYNLPMPIKTTDCYRIPEKVLSQELSGETVLLDLQGEVYFGLNDVGTRIWQLLKQENSIAQTLAILEKEYQVSREQLESDVGRLLKKLIKEGLLCPQAD